jgi:hypothetical protein
MSFLSQLMTKAQTTDAAAAPAAAVTVVGVRVNAGEIIYLQPAQYEGKSIAQLFADNANDLGISSAQVNKFISNGNPVAGGDAPQPGAIYQGATSSMQKG